MPPKSREPLASFVSGARGREFNSRRPDQLTYVASIGEPVGLGARPACCLLGFNGRDAARERCCVPGSPCRGAGTCRRSVEATVKSRSLLVLAALLVRVETAAAQSEFVFLQQDERADSEQL